MIDQYQEMLFRQQVQLLIKQIPELISTLKSQTEAINLLIEKINISIGGQDEGSD